MAENKRYFWLKLGKNFFDDARVRKLSRLEKGDTYINIYLKLLLSCIDTGGELRYEGLEDTFAEEMALKLCTDEKDTAFTLEFLLKYGVLAQDASTQNHRFVNIENYIGSESESAERMRKSRVQAYSPSQCDANVQKCDADVRKCDGDVRICEANVQKCDTEIEKDIKKDLEIKKEKDIEQKKDIDSNSFIDLTLSSPSDCAKSAQPPSPQEGTASIGVGTARERQFSKPTVEQVAQYASSMNFFVDARAFWDFYESKGWKVGQSPMRDWKAALRNWHSRAGTASYRAEAKYSTAKYNNRSE